MLVQKHMQNVGIDSCNAMLVVLQYFQSIIIAVSVFIKVC